MLKVGHRGARAYEPENTLRSYKRALELGADAVELDVRQTKDNKIIVMHDADLKRVTNNETAVADLTLQEITALSLDKSEKIPSFEEALEFLHGKTQVFVELKEAGTEQQVLNIINKVGAKDIVVLVSLLEDVLRTVKQLDPQIKTGLVYAKHKKTPQSST
jgi:glycerophosphoryl diester phosphodiesterase